LIRKISLVIFDLDGTLTPVENIWRFLHERFGTWERGRVAAQKYYRGEITYKEWAENDAGYWAGEPVARFKEALDQIPYRRGVPEVFRALAKNNIRTGIVSAGLSLLADRVAGELGADIAVSNELETNNGYLTGRIAVRVSVKEKRLVVEQIAERLGIPLKETALVGDRGNDLTVPDCFKVAFKPIDSLAKEKADVVIHDDDITRILQYLI